MTDIADKLLRGTVLYRDVVGRRVRLVTAITTKPGLSFHKGEVLRVTGTWRGSFTLACRARDNQQVSHVGPAYFELEEEEIE